MLKRNIDGSVGNLQRARELGITMLSGSDSGNSLGAVYGKYHATEIEILVRDGGYTPLEAITAATKNNAFTLGLEGEVGVVGPGKLADVTIWKVDPLADISILQHSGKLSAVIKDSKMVNLDPQDPD